MHAKPAPARRRVGAPAVDARLRSEAEAAQRVWARTLHREVASGLAAAILELRLVARERYRARPEAPPPTLDSPLEVLATCAATLREVEAAMRPPLLDETGLGAPLGWLADQESSRERLELVLPPALPRLEAEIEWQLFRCVELLVRRGLGGARRVVVTAPPGALVLEASGTRSPEFAFAVAACRARLAGQAVVTVHRGAGARIRVPLPGRQRT